MIVISNNSSRTVTLNPFTSNVPGQTVNGIRAAVIGSINYMVISLGTTSANNNIRYFLQPTSVPVDPTVFTFPLEFYTSTA